jgi:hypothetical protein
MLKFENILGKEFAIWKICRKRNACPGYIEK